MALTIRLSRIGTKGKPAYRVVVAEIRSRRDGAAVEQLGSYDPRAARGGLSLDVARADYWIKHGAKPSDTVRTLISRQRKADARAAEAAAATPAAAPAA